MPDNPIPPAASAAAPGAPTSFPKRILIFFETLRIFFLCRGKQMIAPLRLGPEAMNNDNHGFETRSAPASLTATHRGFTFYVAVPVGSIHECRGWDIRSFACPPKPRAKAGHFQTISPGDRYRGPLDSTNHPSWMAMGIGPPQTTIRKQLKTNEMKKSFIITSMAALAALCFSITAQAQGPVVVSDKDDYAPGETAMFSAAGFQPGEILDFSVAVSDENGLWVPDIAWADVPADASGGAEVDYIVPETWLNKSLQLTVMGLSSGLMATTTFTDSGVLSYSPASTVNLTATAGGAAVSFTQTVTAPKNNLTFGAPVKVSGFGSNQIQQSWVSTNPPGLTFVTGFPPFGQDDAKQWTVFFTVPANTPPGIYTADIKANPPPGSQVGEGPGTQVNLTVIGSSHAPVISCTGTPANLGSAVGCLGTGNSFSHPFPVTYTQSGTNPVFVIARFTRADGTFLNVPVAVVSDQDVGDIITVMLTGGTNPVTISGPGSGSAPFSVQIGAVDNHGLPALPHTCGGTASATIGYAFNGIFSPLSNVATTKVKQGATVPVKFQLADCSGTLITDMNMPGDGSAPLVDVIYVSGAAPTGDPTVTDAGNSNGDTDFARWDPTGMQWIFNLKTNSTYTVGDTYGIQVLPNDDSTHQANISIK
jgi:hypothetical protein